MKKSIYIISSIEIIVGALIYSATSMIKDILPVLGRVAYQAAAAGSYSPREYSVTFSFPNTIATILVIVGILQLVYSFKLKKDE